MTSFVAGICKVLCELEAEGGKTPTKENEWHCNLANGCACHAAFGGFQRQEVFGWVSPVPTQSYRFLAGKTSVLRRVFVALVQ